MKRDTSFVKHNLYHDDWIGIVINSNDPTFSGRAKVRVFGVMDEIKDEHLPWATPINNDFYGSSGGGNISIPKPGQFVRIRFNDGDLYAPEISAIQNIDENLINEIQNDYQGTHVIIYDADVNLKILHQVQSGLLIFFKDSYFQITPDSMVTISTEDANSIIQMEGDTTRIVTKNEVDVAAAAKVTVTADEVVIKGSNTTKIGPGSTYESAILGDELFSLLKTMASTIDAKLPVSGGTLLGIVQSAEPIVKSSNVKISKT